MPEKLGLIRETKEVPFEDLAEALAGALGYGRVTQQFRKDVSKLLMLLEERDGDLQMDN